MKALIIAAGEGKRIREISGDLPKPLIPLLGLSLIERVILSAREAGIKDFVIVVGYKGKEIKERIGDGSRYNVRIEYIENKEWRKGNGLSVLKARDRIKDNFVLLMADHVFDSDILKELTREGLKGKDGILVVDRDMRDYVDLKDATKVKVEEELIKDIGKDLKDYNGIDCGIFLFSPKIFDAIEESIKQGDDSLSGGVKVLARKGRMGYLDIKGRFWIDVDNKNTLEIAEKELLRSLIKDTDGPISRYINRPISLRISRILVNTRVTPNAITGLSFLLSLLSGLIFFLGGWMNFILAGILTQISSIIDGCDGEIARLKFQSSEYGRWIDSVLDRYADAIIILGMSYGCWLGFKDALVWIFGFLALTGSLLNSYTAMKYDQVIREKKMKFRFGRDVRLFIIMAGALMNQIFLTLVFLSIITNLENLRRILVLGHNT